jgi:hypothetical protein
MPRIKYKVTLDEQERARLQDIATRGRHSSQTMLNALCMPLLEAIHRRKFSARQT